MDKAIYRIEYKALSLCSAYSESLCPARCIRVKYRSLVSEAFDRSGFCCCLLKPELEEMGGSD